MLGRSLKGLIGIGAGLAGPVLAGPLFRQFNEIYYRYLHVRRYRRRFVCARLLQPDHFKSPSYAPEGVQNYVHLPNLCTMIQ